LGVRYEASNSVKSRFPLHPLCWRGAPEESRGPVISLDGIRRELRISPSADQGVVVQEARARDLLRRRASFIWNPHFAVDNNRLW